MAKARGTKRKRAAATKRKPVKAAATKPRSARERKAKAKAKKHPPKVDVSRRRKPAPVVKKKPPTGTVKSGGRKPAPKTKPVAAPRKVPEFAQHVKRAPGRKGFQHPAPPTPASKRRKLSKNPEAVRSRKRRAEQKGIAQALEALRQEKLEARRRRDRERREQRKRKIIGGGGRGRSERELAEGWLEEIREHAAHVVPTSLEVLPEGGTGGAGGGDAGASPWLVIGRFDFHEAIGYRTLGEIFESIAEDYLLEAKIHPERLSQIRIIFNDPNAKRGEGDSIVSKIAGWQFALGDLIGEILGGGPEDEGALAVRYDETGIETFYVYFSQTITAYANAGPWSRTQTVSLKR